MTPTPNDRGSITPFVMIFASLLVLVTGLVLDGGRILNGKREARNIAQSAARAGAQAIDDELVRQGATVILDDGEARQLACAFLSRADHPCGQNAGVVVNGNIVTVTVRDSVDPMMMVGVATQAFEVEGVACVARGIATADCG